MHFSSNTLSIDIQAKKRGIQLFVVSVGNWYNEAEMNAIASYPYSQTRFTMTEYVDLNRNDFTGRTRSIFCNSKK